MKAECLTLMAALIGCACKCNDGFSDLSPAMQAFLPASAPLLGGMVSGGQMSLTCDGPCPTPSPTAAPSSPSVVPSSPLALPSSRAERTGAPSVLSPASRCLQTS